MNDLVIIFVLQICLRVFTILFPVILNEEKKV